MSGDELIRALAGLTANLAPSSHTTPADLSQARRTIATALVGGVLHTAAKVANLHMASFDTETREDIEAAANAALTTKARLPTVTMRSVPSSLLQPDTLKAASRGRAITSTQGPFLDQLGRETWVDVFEPIEVVGVIRSGQAKPFLYVSVPVGPGNVKKLELGTGSVWIVADILDPASPVGGYVGLRIKSGTVLFDAGVTHSSNVITVPAFSTVELDLQLDPQPVPSGSGPGADARQAAVTTPATAIFRFAPAGALVPRTAPASLKVFGWKGKLASTAGAAKFDTLTRRIEIALVPKSDQFKVTDHRSNLLQVEGSAKIVHAAWSIPVTIADPSTLSQAAGTGGITLHLATGLQARWKGRDAKTIVGTSALVVELGALELLAATARTVNSPQHASLWKGAAPSKALGSFDLRFPKPFAFAFVAESIGIDALVIAPFLRLKADQPVTINGDLFPFESAAATVILVETAAGTNFLIEATGLVLRRARERAIALKNLVMRLSDARALIAFGSYVDAGCVSGTLALFFELRSVLPILPDPYAANVAWDPRRQNDVRSTIGVVASVSRWQPAVDPVLDIILLSGDAPINSLSAAPPNTPGSFNRQNLIANNNGEVLAATQQRVEAVSGGSETSFVLLDVSTNASLFGVGFVAGTGKSPTRTSTSGSGASGGFENLYLTAPGSRVRILTLPPVQWEPVATDDPKNPSFPSPLSYPNSGGSTVIATDSVTLVPVAPRPAIDCLLANYNGPQRNRAIVRFTLPFGILAVAELQKHPFSSLFLGPFLSDIQPDFPSAGMKGGVQLRFQAATPLFVTPGLVTESPSFPGFAQQLSNALFMGVPVPENVLTPIDGTFNSNFGFTSSNPRVPLTRLDLSGYGESVFSEWVNPTDGGALISKAHFEVMIGRTRLEVVQGHSILYPYAIRVIRTITIERGNGAAMIRRDSGWQPASDGIYDFPASAGLITHPGIVRGVSRVSNIRDTGQRFITSDGTTELMAVRFDCMADIEHAIQGSGPQGVAARDQVGYVQLTNILPMTPDQYSELLVYAGTLGGAIDCTVDVGASGQKMRVGRIGVAATPGMGGPEFAMAAWGSPLFPTGGTWSFLRQRSPTEAPSAVDLQLGVPLVRAGAANGPPSSAPYRFADPQDVLTPESPNADYGIVHSTGTQRTYFPRPKIELGSHQITSARAPFLADPYSLGTAISLFPQLGVTIPFPNANYSLDIASDGNYALHLPTPSFRPPPLQRVLLDAPPIRTLVEYADENGNPSTVTVVIDTAAPIPWSSRIQNISLSTHDGARNEITRIVGDMEASAEKATALQNSRLVFGDALKPIQALVSFLENFGPIPPVNVSMTNDASIKAGLKIDFEKILEHNPTVGAFLKKFVIDLDFEVAETVHPLATEAEATFELTLKFPTPFTPVVGIALAKVKIQLNSGFGTSYTFTIGVGVGVSYDVGDFNITAYFAETIFLIAGDTIFGLGCSVLIRGTVDLVVISIQVTVEAKEALLKVTCGAGADSTIWGVAQLSYSFDVTIAWVIDIEYDAQIQSSHNFDGGPCPLPDVV